METRFDVGASKVSSYGTYFGGTFEPNGSPKSFDLEKIFADPQSNIEKVVKLAKYYYSKNGLIMRTINIIRDFGTGSYEIVYPNRSKRVKKVIEEFIKRIGLSQVLRDMIFELAISGNVSGYNRDGARIDIYPIWMVQPTPLLVGTKPVMKWIVDNANLTLNGIDLQNKQIYDNLQKAYPAEVLGAMRNGKLEAYLDSTKSFFAKVNSSRYERFGLPFIITAFDDLAHKTVLKEAENATANGIIEMILRIGVGDSTLTPQVPGADVVDFYHNMITATKGSLKVTVPWFVNMSWIAPDTKIFGPSKFEQVDKDILNSLGVSLTLIRGEGGGNYSEGVISLTGLLKTIESLQEPLPAIVEDWFAAELKRNGINPEDNCPSIKFLPVEIDKSARLQLLQWLFTSAGLPYEILYKEAGYDYMTVKLTRQEENEEKTEDIFKLRTQPFQGQQPGDNPSNPDNKGGAPEKNADQRTTDKSQSNNKTPRPSTKK